MKTISLPKRSSLKPVLIYEGQLFEPDADEIKKYFYRITHFSQLLK